MPTKATTSRSSDSVGRSGMSRSHSDSISSSASGSLSDSDIFADRDPLSMRSSRPLTMGERDLNKMETQLEDAGYREGITAGKLGALQSGFDEGFSAGAPLGRAVGRLRGEVTSLCVYLGRLVADLELSHPGPSSRSPCTAYGGGGGAGEGSSNSEQEGQQQQHIELQYEDGEVLPDRKSRTANGNGIHHSPAENSHPVFAKEDLPPGPGRARVRLKNRTGAVASSSSASGGGGGSAARMLANSTTTAHLKPGDIVALLHEAQALLRDTQDLSLKKLAPPDEEALAHEHEHAMMAQQQGEFDGGKMMASWKGESEEERARREAILPGLYARLYAAKEVLGLA
ncbi:hypothetical protein A4X09_0g1486 [Tilletia walkeri]|uniref:Protein YAE1 n=1 Tax=Tilletia walkeri TaxID=117179 RepID=A0A8X7T6P9_9BASI|nr:hypothetical protein A4X09_0g1486 [Tilletia walkeri]